MAWLDGPELGPSMEAYLRHGLSDSFDLDLQVLTSAHPFQPDSKSPPQVDAVTPALPWALGVSSGLVYRWDVLRTIPYAGMSVGVYEWHGVDAALNGAQFGASARLGVDYLLTRDVVLSVQASAHCVLADSDVRFPWLQLAVGAGYVWGW